MRCIILLFGIVCVAPIATMRGAEPNLECVAWPSPADLAVVSRGVHSAAVLALSEFHALVDEKDFRDLGFDSLEQARTSTLGEPLVVYRLPLKTLKAYGTNTGTDQMLRPAGKVIYPLMAASQVRSSITLQNPRGHWEASDYGFADLARMLTDSRDKLAARCQLAGSQVFVVEVAALERFFVGCLWTNGPTRGPMIATVAADPGLNLAAYEALPIAELASRLVPVARAHRGFPTPPTPRGPIAPDGQPAGTNRPPSPGPP